MKQDITIIKVVVGSSAGIVAAADLPDAPGLVVAVAVFCPAAVAVPLF